MASRVNKQSHTRSSRKSEDSSHASGSGERSHKGVVYDRETGDTIIYGKSAPCKGFEKKCVNTASRGQDGMCTECHRDKRNFERRCPNFKDCEGYRRWNRDEEALYDLCTKCHREEVTEEKKCPWWEECGNLRKWDRENGRLFNCCKKCQDILDKECPNYDVCKGRRGWDHDAGERFPLCYDCSHPAKKSGTRTIVVK